MIATFGGALKLEVPANVTPCYSPDTDERAYLAWLFESTDPIDHREAAELCTGCPFRLGCFALAAEQLKSAPTRGVPNGTWGGVLFVNGKVKTPGNLAAGAQ